MVQPQIPLFTSIPPKWSRPAHGRNFGPAWLQLCIASWRESGFRPISLNSVPDIEVFRMVPIEFQPVARTQPLIIDLLGAAKKTGSRIAGIVNADCMTIPLLKPGEALENLLDNGIVIVERLNLSQQDLRPTGQSCLGFDAFFFTIESLEKISWSEDWKIGSVWWDYCFPLAFLAASQKIRTLPSPGLIHLDHEQRWRRDEWRSSLPKLIRAVGENATLWEKAKLRLVANPKHDDDFLPFIKFVFHWLRNREKLYTPSHESIEELVTFALAAMATQAQPQLSVTQLARQIPGATMRTARRIFTRAGRVVGYRNDSAL
jgi:hypothetical protein